MLSPPPEASTAQVPHAECCPRCGGGLRCGARGPAPCPCTAFTLAPDLLVALRKRYAGCLCLACLRELATPT